MAWEGRFGDRKMQKNLVPPVGGSAPEPPGNAGRPPLGAEKSDPLWNQKFQLNPAKENFIPAENNLIPAKKKFVQPRNF